MFDSETIDPLFSFVFWFVIVGWFVFGFAFVFRKRPKASTKRVRTNRSLWGVLLMGIGMFLVWRIRRPMGLAFIPNSVEASYVLDVAACCLTIGSVWLILAAIRLLGKQWSVRATLVEHHELITSGPYALVRHPIYAGIFGMMMATGIANGYWYVLLAAMGFSLMGILLRIREEEKLLQATFGTAFEAYRGSVPALLPRVRSTRHVA